MNFLLFLPIFSQFVINISARQLRVTDQVFLDIHHQDKPLGRIVIGLFGDLAPKAVKNFKILATKGIKGKSYKGTRFNRIIKRFMIQGKNTNGCQFIITTKGTPWLDGIHTVIGKVVEGQKFVHMMEQIPTDADDRPKENVFIFNSGVLPTEPFYISDNPNDLWGWIKASAVPLTFSFSILGFFQWMISKMEI
ncbi:peptidyl-prolyl cis-trans isomerase, rhodopsin-specific isozyme-like isoform X2 [Maniola jurtina]|uniref:peptidyl-prolyl cis-trans isomerase, rhodopsin-specific isozyme-like isoform X2 n=1 Tax=Maniola jurtina TaxID=191418 RepID=UPI001E68D54D|nr:peptidyl-prolyl cis-trans isomerase, rhodopsin-specific isozyme-like isoform X2 [Maniola jurtina]